MAKNNKKYLEQEKPKGKIAAVVLLLIMVISIAGFAVLMGGPIADSETGSQSEVPMGEIFQDPNTGQRYIGTVRNNEQFIFENTTGYEKDTQMMDIAENIKAKDNIEIYLDSNFNSAESIFLLEKALIGIKKPYSKTIDKTCNPNKLVLTNNQSLYKGCIIFNPAKNDEYRRSEILVYHLVK